MTQDTRIVLSGHAEDMIVERGIERTWSNKQSANPKSWKQIQPAQASCAPFEVSRKEAAGSCA